MIWRAVSTMTCAAFRSPFASDGTNAFACSSVTWGGNGATFEVQLLLKACPAYCRFRLPGDGQNGLVVALGIVEARDKVSSAWTAGREADPPARQ